MPGPRPVRRAGLRRRRRLYTSSSKFNKPGTIPLEFATDIDDGCPHDCGLCPDHQQHACLGIIEVNSACDMACPLCFAEAGPGFSLTLEEVEDILDHFVAPKAIRKSCSSPAASRPSIRRSLPCCGPPSTRHSERHAEHQRQAHRARRPLPRRTGRGARPTSTSSSTASKTRPIASSAASPTSCRENARARPARRDRLHRHPGSRH